MCFQSAFLVSIIVLKFNFAPYNKLLISYIGNDFVLCSMNYVHDCYYNYLMEYKYVLSNILESCCFLKYPNKLKVYFSLHQCIFLIIHFIITDISRLWSLNDRCEAVITYLREWHPRGLLIRFYHIFSKLRSVCLYQSLPHFPENP